MTTITEDYVSFEVAKLLKEKGFNWQCFAYYSEYIDKWKTLKLWKKYAKTYDTVRNNGYVLVPTLQMACKWLRKVHGLSVETFSIKGTSNVCPVFWKGNVVKLLTQDRAFSSELVDSYEEAVEAALKYCLENLI